MPKWRLVFNGDDVYTEKVARIHKLTQEVETKIDNIPGVVDNTNSSSTTDALSARMGKVLQDQITELSWVWTYISGWDCTTWLPLTEPQEDPYTYKVWNYYIVARVGATNYKPHWGTYTQWVPSTDIELDAVSINDWYMFDWSNWIRQPAWERAITVDSHMSASSVNPVENRVITSALSTKQDTINDLATIRAWAAKWATSLQPWANISELTNNLWFQTAWDVASAIQTLAPEWVWTWVLTLQKNATTVDTFSANATQNKTINITVPTTVSELSDSSDYATKTYVDTAAGSITHAWPTAPSNPSEWELWYDTTNDLLKVYDWTNWVVIWKTYTAWTNISIDANNQISATDTTYTAWTWLWLSWTEFSVDTNTIATKLYVDTSVAWATHSWAVAPENPTVWTLWYDSTNWVLKIWNWTSWVSLQELLVSWTNIKTINNHNILWSWNIDIIWVEEIQFVTQTEYDNLPSSKLTDWKSYFIYSWHWSWIVSDEPFSSSWDWDTTHAPSKNAIYDVLWNVETLLSNI